METIQAHERFVPRTAIVAGRWHHDYEHYARVLRARNQEFASSWRPTSEESPAPPWTWRILTALALGSGVLSILLWGVGGP